LEQSGGVLEEEKYVGGGTSARHQKKKPGEANREDTHDTSMLIQVLRICSCYHLASDQTIRRNKKKKKKKKKAPKEKSG